MLATSAAPQMVSSIAFGWRAGWLCLLLLNQKSFFSENAVKGVVERAPYDRKATNTVGAVFLFSRVRPRHFIVSPSQANTDFFVKEDCT